MGRIVDDVRRVAALIHDIGRSAQAQSSDIAQVSTSVNDLDTSTQQNAALAEQSAAAADNLSLQAGRLAEAVTYFKL